MTKNELRAHVSIIVGKGARRGPHPEVLSLRESMAIVDALVASDEAPEWDAVLVGEDQLRAVIRVLRTM